MLSKKYKVIIFDFDDTLVESRPLKWAHHQEVARRFYNFEITHEVLLEHWGKPFSKMIDHLYNGIDTTENIIEKIFSINDVFHKKLFPKSLEVIDLLLEKNIKLCILSSASKIHIEHDLNRLNFPINDFMIIQGAEDTIVHKPEPEVFTPIINELKKQNIFAEDILYVGDSLDDFEASNGAGIDFIGVTTGLYKDTDFKEKGVKHTVNNLEEILALI